MMLPLLLSHRVPEDWRAQAAVFDELFFVFLVVGTIVGVIVVAYTLYNGYKYRDGNEKSGNPDDDSFDPPTVGELPRGQGGGKGKKLFLSFGISAVIVVSLVVYSYGLLLYVEQGSASQADTDMEIEVVGSQFQWEFVYPNGYTQTNELRVPQGTVVKLAVTSDDVWHNFGVTELRFKADAIPGEYSNTWFIANETGTYTAECFELCGTGHSYMKADIVVMPEEDFEEWYAETDGGEN